MKRLILLALVALAVAMDMDDLSRVEFHPVNAGSKAFHWIATLATLFMVPCVASALAFAHVYHMASFLHIACLCYSVFESLFLDFPDNIDNHENRTSKGTLWFLTWLLAATVFFGTLLNGSNVLVNRWRRQQGSLQPYSAASSAVGRVYKTLAFAVALTGWVRVSMAPVALFGFCYGKATGQCIAHGIMGSSFVLYGFVLAWVLVVPWMRSRGCSPARGPARDGGDGSREIDARDPPRAVFSQEFYDSSLMCLWGIVNTFTEHRWGREAWSHGDYQHTAMGIIWWCGGLLGMWLLRRRGTRNVLPAVLLIYTGWAMSEHSQHLELSTKVHAMFGLTLMAGGFARIVEICFVLRDAPADLHGRIRVFQHLPPLCLVLSGVMFMAANEEQLELVHGLGADHLSYLMVVIGAGFMIYLWILVMIALFLRLVGYDEDGPLRASGYEDMADDGLTEFELADLSDSES